MKYFLFFTLLVIAPSVTAKSYYEKQGLKAFRAKQYEQAIDWFKKEVDEGNASSGLLFNLATSYYKNGNFRKAKFIYMQLLKTDNYNVKILYNLGVVEKKLGNTERAKNLFKAVSQSDNLRLSGAAEQQLKRLYNAPLSKQENLFASLSINQAHNDSILKTDNGEVVGEGDHYTELLGVASLNNLFYKHSGWGLNGIILNTLHNEATEQDYFLYSLGLGKKHKTGLGKLSWMFETEGSALGGDDYLSSLVFTGNLDIRKRNNKWRLQYRYKDSSAQSDQFESVTGDAHRAEVRWRRTLSSRHAVSLKYRFDQINRTPQLNSIELEDGPFSYTSDTSLNRNKLIGSWSYRPNHRFEWVTGAEFGQANNSEFIIWEDGIIESRDDTIFAASITASWEITSHWVLNSAYRYRSNSSNQTQYDYTQNIFSIGVDWVY